ncbi:MAG: hypothetical protein L3J69_01185 [Desulfobacula sp.]|nr:hypothetical protein [Desulfobacula sp.]
MCGYDNNCVYTGKDEFIDFYNTKIKKSDIIIYCGEIVDRFLSYSWKRFFDRRFFNTHQPTLVEKQIGFLVSGSLSQNYNIRQVIEGMIDFEMGHLVDIVTDEIADSAIIDSQIQNLAERLNWYSENNYMRPSTFPAIGGRKIFRDDVWGRLRFVFQGDYKYYEENGTFDFPQNDLESINLNDQMSGMMENPFVRKRIISKIADQFKNV